MQKNTIEISNYLEIIEYIKNNFKFPLNENTLLQSKIILDLNKEHFFKYLIEYLTNPSFKDSKNNNLIHFLIYSNQEKLLFASKDKQIKEHIMAVVYDFNKFLPTNSKNIEQTILLYKNFFHNISTNNYYKKQEHSILMFFYLKVNEMNEDNIEEIISYIKENNSISQDLFSIIDTLDKINILKKDNISKETFNYSLLKILISNMNINKIDKDEINKILSDIIDIDKLKKMSTFDQEKFIVKLKTIQNFKYYENTFFDLFIENIFQKNEISFFPLIYKKLEPPSLNKFYPKEKIINKEEYIKYFAENNDSDIFYFEYKDFNIYLDTKIQKYKNNTKKLEEILNNFFKYLDKKDDWKNRYSNTKFDYKIEYNLLKSIELYIPNFIQNNISANFLHKFEITNEKGETIRINLNEDYIISSIKDFALKNVTYNKLQILKEMNEYFKNNNNFDEFIYSNKSMYFTIGAGNSDIDVNTFGNSNEYQEYFLEKNDTYTDAEKNQQQLIYVDENFDFKYPKKIFEYFEYFKSNTKELEKEILSLKKALFKEFIEKEVKETRTLR